MFHYKLDYNAKTAFFQRLIAFIGIVENYPLSFRIDKFRIYFENYLSKKLKNDLIQINVFLFYSVHIYLINTIQYYIYVSNRYIPKIRICLAC